MEDIDKGVGPKECLKYNTIFLSLIGVWPYQTLREKILFRLLWMSQQLVTMVTEVIKLYEVRTDMDLVIEAVPPIIYNRAIDVKLINVIIHQSKMKKLLIWMQEDWNSLSNESEIKTLSYYAGLGKLLNLGYIGMIYSSLGMCMILPFTSVFLDMVDPLNESRPVQQLIMNEFFIDENKYFYLIYLYGCFTVLCSSIPLVASDAFYMNCTYHACGIIKILGYCDVINDTYSTSFFIVLFISTALMSFSGVTILIKMDDMTQFNEMLKFGIFTTAQIFHLFYFNFMGQNVLNAMDKLSRDLYINEWYRMPTKVQKLLQFMIMRNNKPIVMAAGLFPLCLATFTIVVKTSMSYFTVIKSTR